MKKIVLFLTIIFLPFAIDIVNAKENCLGTDSPNNTYPCGNGKGNCTWWAAHKRPDLNFSKINGKRRDAKEWKWYAQQNEMAIGNSPVAGSIVVFDAWGNNSYGHVAYVNVVSGTGTFSVTEQDYFGFYGAGTVSAIYYPVSDGYKRNNSGKTMPILGFILPPDKCSNNLDGGITCQHGLHTHIIHDDYRCSDGKCWEPGGETNCWDANVWFEADGARVSNPVIMRERSMCAEVYNSGNPTDGIGGSSSTPENSTDHNIAIQQLLIKEQGSTYAHHIDKTIFS